MVAPTHARLSIVRQCHLVSIARSSFYYEGQGESPVNLRLLRVIDEQFLETPFYGSRQMTRWLRRQGDTVSRKRVRRLMRRLGVHAVCQRPRTSQSHPGHRIYPYLLRDLQITQPNHVWCTDPSAHGHREGQPGLGTGTGRGHDVKEPDVVGKDVPCRGPRGVLHADVWVAHTNREPSGDGDVSKRDLPQAGVNSLHVHPVEIPPARMDVRTPHPVHARLGRGR